MSKILVVFKCLNPRRLFIFFQNLVTTEEQQLMSSTCDSGKEGIMGQGDLDIRCISTCNAVNQTSSSSTLTPTHRKTNCMTPHTADANTRYLEPEP